MFSGTSDIDRLHEAIDAHRRFVSERGQRSTHEFLACHENLRDLLEPLLASPAKGSQANTNARVLGDFRLLGELGRGGMGVVYDAEQISLHRPVAVKVLPCRLALDPDARARFERESRLTASLDHPCIAKIISADANDDVIWYAMERIDGVSLDRVLQRTKDTRAVKMTGPLFESAVHELCEECSIDTARDPPTDGAQSSVWRSGYVATVVRIGAQIAATLHHAHQHGVVHRDVKPANVMLRCNGTAVLTDFGLARELDTPSITLTGDFVGTPYYSAPEQLTSARNLDWRVDVFALGAMLYELLTHRRPFEASTADEVRQRILSVEPPRPSRFNPKIPADLSAVLLKALEKDPDRRYATAEAMADDLRAVATARPVQARPVRVHARVVRWARRHPLPSAFVAVLAIGAGVSAWFAIDRVGKNLELSQRQREAKAAVASYQQMRDVPLAEDLAQEAEDDLWPAHPHMVDTMDRWLVRARALGDRAAAHREKLTEFRKKALPARPEVERQLDELPSLREKRWRFEDYEDQFLHGIFAGLVAKIDRLLGEDGLIAQIEGRRQRAATLRVRSLQDPGEDWERVLADIAKSEKYADVKALAPQLGLVPLGADPQSELEEFAVLDTGAVPKRDTKGSLQFDGSTAIVLVLIPPGTFAMGAQSIAPQQANYDPQAVLHESPVHEVKLDAFFLSKYEMTQGQWLRVKRSNPSYFFPGRTMGGRTISAQNPVEKVSWFDCSEAMRRLGLVLPTEAQWEYGTRGGTTTVWWTGQDTSSLTGAANMQDEHMPESHAGSDRPYEPDLTDGHAVHAPVGSFRANAFGLHNVIGNVAEWCRDRWGGYDQSARPGDGLREFDSSNRVLRGGAWGFVGRSATRKRAVPELFSGAVGVRPSRVITR